MAKILLLVNQPLELFLAMRPNRPRDLLSTYNAFQRNLNHHATEIVATVCETPNVLYPFYCYLERQVYVKIIRFI